MIMTQSKQVKSTTRDFTLMVIGQIISITGAALLRFSMSLYILDITGRADLFGTLYALSSLPMLLSPVGGAIADRFSRRNLMVIFDFSSAAVIFAMFVLLNTGGANVVAVGVVMFLLALISALYQPAVQASIPVLVAPDKIEGANGIVSGVGALAGLLAPVMGGWLYGIVGIKQLVLVSGIAFFFSAVMEIFINIPFVKRQSDRGMLKTLGGDIKAGFAYVVKQPPVFKAMIIAALLNLVLTPFYIVGIPIILRNTMHASDTVYGIGMGLFQLSSILGALLVGVFSKKLSVRTLYKWILIMALLIVPMGIVLLPGVLNLGFYPSFLLFTAGVVPIGLLLMVLSIYVMAKVQKNTPTEMVGKTMAIIMAVAQCAAPVGQFLYGLLFTWFATQNVVPVCIMFILVLVLALVAKQFYKNEREFD